MKRQGGWVRTSWLGTNTGKRQKQRQRSHKKAGGDCAQLRTWAKWRIAERHGEKRRGGAGDGAGAGVRRLWLVDVACGL